jgi:glycine cleavage system regulatory protein
MLISLVFNNFNKKITYKLKKLSKIKVLLEAFKKAQVKAEAKVKAKVEVKVEVKAKIQIIDKIVRLK